MRFPESVFAVRAAVDPAHDEEFNRWYDDEHGADALELLGCLGAARYKVLEGDGSHHYMAAYAFANEAAMRAALAGHGFRELVRRFDEAVGAFSSRARTLYGKVLEIERAGADSGESSGLASQP